MLCVLALATSGSVGGGYFIAEYRDAAKYPDRPRFRDGCARQTGNFLPTPKKHGKFTPMPFVPLSPEEKKLFPPLCPSPEHNPPGMIVITEPIKYRCPKCGQESILLPSSITA